MCAYVHVCGFVSITYHKSVHVRYVWKVCRVLVCACVFVVCVLCVFSMCECMCIHVCLFRVCEGFSVCCVCVCVSIWGMNMSEQCVWSEQMWVNSVCMCVCGGGGGNVSEQCVYVCEGGWIWISSVCVCLFSTCIQPYPTYLSTLKICIMLKLYTE